MGMLRRLGRRLKEMAQVKFFNHGWTQMNTD